MSEKAAGRQPRILILATASCAYPGADYVGQTHKEYPANVYILRLNSPVILPEEFYLRCFEKGFDGVIAMSCGNECPYAGAYERFAERLGRVHASMRKRGLDPRRLRLCSICTVCADSFLKEIRQMQELVMTEAAA